MSLVPNLTKQIINSKFLKMDNFEGPRQEYQPEKSDFLDISRYVPIFNIINADMNRYDR